MYDAVLSRQQTHTGAAIEDILELLNGSAEKAIEDWLDIQTLCFNRKGQLCIAEKTPTARINEAWGEGKGEWEAEGDAESEQEVERSEFEQDSADESSDGDAGSGCGDAGDNLAP